MCVDDEDLAGRREKPDTQWLTKLWWDFLGACAIGGALALLLIAAAAA